MAGKMTPMMEQYISIKNRYKNCILFYRLGDFYEMFFDDALVASKILDITLTGKDCGMEERAPMCGVPFHSADGYIAKLVENGKKVAICEQIEDPRKAKGIVKRDVIRVITPGTLLDTNALDEGKNNYIMCIYRDLNGYGIATCDITTGDLIVTEINYDDRSKVIDFIAMYKPAEIIANYEKDDFLAEEINNIFDVDIAYIEDYNFVFDNCYENLISVFNVENLDKFNLENNKYSVIASGALTGYISENYKGKNGVIFGIRKFQPDDFMVLDISSRKNLELTQSINDGGKRGSLLWVIDKTKTAMGARAIRNIIEQPLVDTNKINKRLNGVEELKNKVFEREEIRECLSHIYDFERIISKVSYDNANAKDLNTLRCSLEILPEIKKTLSSLKSDIFNDIYERLDTMDDFWGTLKLFIVDDPPFSVREGGMIREGMNPELDKLREARDRGDELIKEIEEREKERTGIKKLKIKYNKVFGYFIEVTNSFKELVPDDYIRKQTLANCERYITSELKDAETYILDADEKAVELEYNIFRDMISVAYNNAERVINAAKIVGEIDYLQSLAEVAERNNYVKPKVNTNGIIQIKDGRHPVVESIIGSDFIPNDTYLDLTSETIGIVTGPNMAGKSTYMRQVALIVLMAQIGSFVPAASAYIGITDRIFTRVGASDNLATGQSTFMVEMTEVSNILKNATRNSLIILDEVGRGTSTYDGLSIAWAVTEYLASKVCARTLFATHYHELTKMSDDFLNVINYRVSVKEDGENVVFLRKIVEGSTDKSYGIHVAKLAGVPMAVVKRAENILSQIDVKDTNVSGDVSEFYSKDFEKEENYKKIIASLKRIDINTMTPLDAMQFIAKIKSKIDD